MAVLVLGGWPCGMASGEQPQGQPTHVVALWPQGAPGAVGQQPEDKPELWVYLPQQRATGAGIVVCPGGGYGTLALGHEGRDIAAWLNGNGIAAFVLKYRLGPRYRHPAPLQDATRAMRLVRHGAEQYGVDPQRIGILGFSAGGHLASTVATHFDEGDPQAADPVERHSSRPDFAVLCYPVISLAAEFSHGGSRRNLLGDAPDAALVESLSNERQVTSQTPPTFLFHTNADTGVPPENSIAFYLALRKARVPAELHIFEPGRHGLGLAPQEPAVSAWPELCLRWLRTRGVLRDAVDP
jgi:acetyl esterase/lipase